MVSENVLPKPVALNLRDFHDEGVVGLGVRHAAPQGCPTDFPESVAVWRVPVCVLDLEYALPIQLAVDGGVSLQRIRPT